MTATKIQPVAEICSASHDDAQFGERAIKPLRDISGFEYGTQLYAGAAPAAVARWGCEDRSAWFALAMGAAASLEDAANCLRDKDAQKAAMGAATHVRESCNKLWWAAPALEAPAAPLDDSELEDLAHSANQECLSFGMSLDPFLRLAKTVRDRMLAAASQAPADLQAAPVAWMYQRHGSDFGAWFMAAGQEADDLRVGRPNIMVPCPNHYGWTALYAAPQAPAAPVVLPSGWVPCILTHDGQHPEEVAYGPQIMMDRLKKWLGRYFELLAQAAPAAPVAAAIPDAAYCALQYVEHALAAIANREELADGAFQPMDSIGKASKRAKAALARLQSVAHHFSAAAAPAAPAEPVELDIDRVLALADLHADDSREDGVRMLDRGGLVALAQDVLRIFAPEAAPAAPAVDAETVKKAARYDWLRGSNVANGTVLAEHFGGSRMQDFDAVIDAKIAARATQAKEGGA